MMRERERARERERKRETKLVKEMKIKKNKSCNMKYKNHKQGQAGYRWYTDVRIDGGVCVVLCSQQVITIIYFAVHGGWGSWVVNGSDWCVGECNKTGNHTVFLRRECDSSGPQHGGRRCSNGTDTMNRTEKCQVNCDPGTSSSTSFLFYLCSFQIKKIIISAP